jgi:hypothetical protein
MYVIERDPGAGKTTLALQFLLDGVRRLFFPNRARRCGRNVDPPIQYRGRVEDRLFRCASELESALNAKCVMRQFGASDKQRGIPQLDSIPPAARSPGRFAMLSRQESGRPRQRRRRAAPRRPPSQRHRSASRRTAYFESVASRRLLEPVPP